jgi:hypothetical protein
MAKKETKTSWWSLKIEDIELFDEIHNKIRDR